MNCIAISTGIIVKCILRQELSIPLILQPHLVASALKIYLVYLHCTNSLPSFFASSDLS